MNGILTQDYDIALRFARLREEKRHNYVRKVAEVGHIETITSPSRHL